MTQYQMAVCRYGIDGIAQIGGSDGHHAFYILSGNIASAGKRNAKNTGFVASGALILEGQGELLHFSVMPAEAQQSTKYEAALAARFDHPSGPALLRLDQVTFPAKARAYRHIHPGPGIRYLISGALEIQSDHDTQMMEPDDAWFEDANSPVQATASDVPETSFVRVLILPVAFEGKPTIKLLNAEDENLPKRQTNQRYGDQIITL